MKITQSVFYEILDYISKISSPELLKLAQIGGKAPDWKDTFYVSKQLYDRTLWNIWINLIIIFFWGGGAWHLKAVYYQDVQCSSHVKSNETSYKVYGKILDFGQNPELSNRK